MNIPNFDLHPKQSSLWKKDLIFLFHSMKSNLYLFICERIVNLWAFYWLFGVFKRQRLLVRRLEGRQKRLFEKIQSENQKVKKKML